MNINLIHDEISLIFNSIDFDYSGKVSYPEFSADFKHVVDTDINDLIREEKEKANIP